MNTHEPERPSLVELVTGPFRGLDIYPRAAVLGAGRGIGLLVLVTTLAAALVAGIWTVRLLGKVDSMADSAIWFMPRVNIADGFATVEADPGRIIETDRVVILFDTVSEQPEIPRGVGADDRPRVLVRHRAMLLFTPERSVPMALPWIRVNEGLGPVSVDGPELITALRRFVPRMVLTLAGVALLAVLLWQVLLAALMVGLYRALFGRGLYVPGVSVLFSVASVAALPPLVLGAALLAVGRQELAVAVQGVSFGALFLLGATRVRLGDERPGVAAPPEPGLVEPGAEESAAEESSETPEAPAPEPAARPVATEL